MSVESILLSMGQRPEEERVDREYIRRLHRSCHGCRRYIRECDDIIVLYWKIHPAHKRLLQRRIRQLYKGHCFWWLSSEPGDGGGWISCTWCCGLQKAQKFLPCKSDQFALRCAWMNRTDRPSWATDAVSDEPCLISLDQQRRQAIARLARFRCVNNPRARSDEMACVVGAAVSSDDVLQMIVEYMYPKKVAISSASRRRTQMRSSFALPSALSLSLSSTHATPTGGKTHKRKVDAAFDRVIPVTMSFIHAKLPYKDCSKHRIRGTSDDDGDICVLCAEMCSGRYNQIEGRFDSVRYSRDADDDTVYCCDHCMREYFDYDAVHDGDFKIIFSDNGLFHGYEQFRMND